MRRLKALKHTHGTVDLVKRAAADAANLVVMEPLCGATAERFRHRLNSNLQSLVGGLLVESATVGPVRIEHDHIQCDIFVKPIIELADIHFTFTLARDHTLGHVYNEP